MDDSPEHFVARDKARGLAWRLERLLQERRLAWRGEALGMSALVDDAPEALGALAEEAQATAEGIVAGRLRDRERGFMEVPCATALEGVAIRLRLARELLQVPGILGEREETAREGVLEQIEACIARLTAFVAAYDEKRPLGTPASTDLARVVERVERPFAQLRALREKTGEVPPAVEPRPPALSTSAPGLEDLLLAVRAALPETPGAWTYTPGAPGRPLVLALGASTDLDAVPVPAPAARAADVLGFVQQVSVEARGRQGPLSGAEPSSIAVRLLDPAGAALGTVAQAAAGGAARLASYAERAVRQLLDAPGWEGEGPPPPARLVAVLGLLQALDRSLAETLVPRLGAGAARTAAAMLPRESTRKAPVKRGLLRDLEAAFVGFPAHRVSDLAEHLARGGFDARRPPGAADAAVLLALFGRRWALGGTRGDRALDLGDLTDLEVEATVRELLEVDGLRRVLESGAPLEALVLTRLERAAIAILGRLGRLQSAS